MANKPGDMSDPNRPPSDPGSEPVQFGEWLEMTAESRGSTKEEVLEQLISSYWTLNEMTEMIQQPEGEDEDEEAVDNPFDHAVSGKAVPPNRSEYESFVSDVEAQLANMGQRITALEAQLEQDGGMSTEQFEQRLDAEFDTLRRILERLISITNENEEEIDELHRRIREDVAGIREEQSQLDHLRRRAMELGVSEADCDNCGTSVDLSLLPAPTCPTCGRTFTDIEPKRTVLGIGFGSDVLETADERDRDSTRQRRPPAEPDDDDRGRPAPDRQDDRRIGGFEWENERRRRD